MYVTHFVDNIIWFFSIDMSIFLSYIHALNLQFYFNGFWRNPRWSVSIIVIIFLIFHRFLCYCSFSFWRFHIFSGDRQSIMQIDCSFKLNPIHIIIIIIYCVDFQFELERKPARGIVKWIWSIYQFTHVNFNFRYIHLVHNGGEDDDDNNRIIHGSYLFLYILIQHSAYMIQFKDSNNHIYQI